MEENTNNNHSVLDQGQAIIWFVAAMLLCGFAIPVGYIKMGQTGKGWVFFAFHIIFGFTGLSLVAYAAEYWMCYTTQKTRPLGEWEFFPTK